MCQAIIIIKKKKHQWSVSKYQGGKVPLASARIFAAHWHTPQIKVPQALQYVQGTLPLIQVQRHLRCCTVQSWNGSILTSAETRSRGAAPPEKLGRCTGDTEGLPHATSALGPQNDSLPTLCCWAPECFFPQCRADWGREYTQPVLNLPTGALLHRPKNETSAVCKNEETNR